MPSLPPILHDDEDLVAFDKPSGLAVAPDRWDKSKEHLMGLVHAKLGPEVANVHRLDAPTSGVLLCARHREALHQLSGQWEGRRVRKHYVAIVRGLPAVPGIETPEGGRIELPLAEDESRPGRMRVSHAEGKKCETVVRLVHRWRAYAWLACEPLTGRTHQIRVHLSATGAPVLGDNFYGGDEPLLLSRLKPGYKFKEGEAEKPLIRRLALHAEALELEHPRTGAPLVIRAPLPHEFGVAQRYLDRFGA